MTTAGWTALGLATLCVSAIGASPAARVQPSGDTVPENLLRIELRFAAPLQSPLDMRRVILESDGRRIEGAFLDEPLSSANARKVTLLLHPARVKTGVRANNEHGRVLKAGNVVTLRIEALAPRQTVSKSWRVVSPLTTPLAPRNWKLNPPRSGGRSPLLVEMDVPISSAADGLIAIRGPDGLRVKGTAALGDGERTWTFLPDKPWAAGRYALVTHPDLEDPAGNRVCAPFEASRVERQNCEHGTQMPFVVALQRARQSPSKPLTKKGILRRTCRGKTGSQPT